SVKILNSSRPVRIQYNALEKHLARTMCVSIEPYELRIFLNEAKDITDTPVGEAPPIRTPIRYHTRDIASLRHKPLVFEKASPKKTAPITPFDILAVTIYRYQINWIVVLNFMLPVRPVFETVEHDKFFVRGFVEFPN